MTSYVPSSVGMCVCWWEGDQLSVLVLREERKLCGDCKAPLACSGLCTQPMFPLLIGLSCCILFVTASKSDSCAPPILLLFLCAHLYTCVDTHAMACVWKPEDNSGESVLPSHLYIGSTDQPRWRGS